MTPNIIPFAFEDNLVRVVMRDGEPWFVLADVCRSLGIRNAPQAATRLDDDEKAVIDASTLTESEGQWGRPLDKTEGQSPEEGSTITFNDSRPAPNGARRLIIISEPGLYRLCMTSNKDEAKRFTRWIAHDVIPSIRKTGAYVAPGVLDQRSEAQAQLPFIDWSTARINAAISTIEAGIKLWGVPAGRRMWELAGFPQMVNGPGDDNLEAEGYEVLDAILNGLINGRPAHSYLAAAIDGDELAHATIKPHGIIVSPNEPMIYIANKSDWLLSLFKRRRPPFYMALRRIDGALWRDLNRKAWFGPMQQRYTALPIDSVENMIYGYRD